MIQVLQYTSLSNFKKSKNKNNKFTKIKNSGKSLIDNNKNTVLRRDSSVLENSFRNYLIAMRGLYRVQLLSQSAKSIFKIPLLLCCVAVLRYNLLLPQLAWWCGPEEFLRFCTLTLNRNEYVPHFIIFIVYFCE